MVYGFELGLYAGIGSLASGFSGVEGVRVLDRCGQCPGNESEYWWLLKTGCRLSS